MGKRQQRFIGKAVHLELPAVVHQSIQLILMAGTTFAGRIIKVGKEEIELVDHRHHKHTFKIAEIAELIIEKEAAY